MNNDRISESELREGAWGIGKDRFGRWIVARYVRGSYSIAPNVAGYFMTPMVATGRTVKTRSEAILRFRIERPAEKLYDMSGCGIYVDPEMLAESVKAVEE